MSHENDLIHNVTINVNVHTNVERTLKIFVQFKRKATVYILKHQSDSFDSLLYSVVFRNIVSAGQNLC